MRDTLIWNVKCLLRSANENHAHINGKYVPARSEGFHSFSYRCKAAWLVFTGKADAVIWDEKQ